MLNYLYDNRLSIRHGAKNQRHKDNKKTGMVNSYWCVEIVCYTFLSFEMVLFCTCKNGAHCNSQFRVWFEYVSKLVKFVWVCQNCVSCVCMYVKWYCLALPKKIKTNSQKKPGPRPLPQVSKKRHSTRRDL